MPIYEYACQNCHHKLEVLQKFSDEPLKDCPACHSAALEKLVSASAFHLKGSGWYATDTRDKGKPQPKTETEAVAKTESVVTDTTQTTTG